MSVSSLIASRRTPIPFAVSPALRPRRPSFLVFGQQFGWVAVGVVHGVRVLHVEVIAARLDVRDFHAPGTFGFLALALLAGFAPPLLLRLKFLDADGFGFVIAFHARRIGVFVVPDFLRRLAFGE